MVKLLKKTKNGDIEINVPESMVKQLLADPRFSVSNAKEIAEDEEEIQESTVAEDGPILPKNRNPKRK